MKNNPQTNFRSVQGALGGSVLDGRELCGSADKGFVLPSRESGQKEAMAAKIQKPANRAAVKGVGRVLAMGQGICIWSIQQSGNCSALDKLRCIDHFADSARLKILGVHLRYTKLAGKRGGGPAGQ